MRRLERLSGAVPAGLAAAVAALVVAVASPPAGASHYRYPAAVQAAFVSNCVRTSGGMVTYCRCVLRRLQHTMPYREFLVVDRAARTGAKVGTASKRKLAAAVVYCVR